MGLHLFRMERLWQEGKPIGGGNKKSAAIGVAHPTGGSCGTFDWSLGDSGVRIVERRRMRGVCWIGRSAGHLVTRKSVKVKSVFD